MPTLQLYNHQIHFTPFVIKGLLALAGLITLVVIGIAESLLQAVVGILALMAWAGIAYWLMLKGQVAYTLTATHLQQHFYQGGWVVKWNNISQIGVCSYEREGWHQPLPWVGIRLKHYAPYSISVLNKKRGIINLKIWYWTRHPMWMPRVNNTPDCKPCWPIECSINVTSLVTIFLFQSRT
ncbi:hypothetical protein VCSRO204_1026 [Vibrio cholerae]|nr:hypothetical protein VCSRO204_1026 [Vibrio cholerae]